MKFAIIGLGYFGSALARELADAGHEVIAIDTDEHHIKDIQDVVAFAAVADGADLTALEQLGIGDVDTAVVAIGEGFEASLMITAHCQQLGARKVYTRVINEVHDHLLGLMQVTGKIRAESLAAAYFTRQLTNEAVRRYFGIDADHGIVELEIPTSLDGVSIADSGLRQHYGLNVVTLRHRRAVAPDAKTASAFTTGGTPDPKALLRSGDRIILFGKLSDVDRFTEDHCEEKNRP